MLSSVQSQSRRMIAQLKAASRGGRVNVGEGCKFLSPVCFNGEGRVDLGSSVILGYPLAPRLGNGSLVIQARTRESVISIGAGTEISNSVTLIALNEIAVGSACLISDLVSIFDSDFHDLSPDARLDSALRMTSDGTTGSVMIGDNVWLGSRCLVLRGSVVGRDSVIGAGSVVHGEIPAGVLAAGVPARVIKRL
jgi:acetyltransferase-like isoleucine patch superfamily enzyme